MKRLLAVLLLLASPVYGEEINATGSYSGVVACERTEDGRLLIADEAHNLGHAAFIENPPEFFEHRLGLSATPIRQYDEEGTDALFGFFGPVVFRFALEEPIRRSA